MRRDVDGVDVEREVTCVVEATGGRPGRVVAPGHDREHLAVAVRVGEVTVVRRPRPVVATERQVAHQKHAQRSRLATHAVPFACQVARGIEVVVVVVVMVTSS